ncbi:Putative store-operated calcium entry-associated regulatory factor [Septoria linicola]|uniref:Store-operated calcium entry-associated regulatory factor n=1 Tax=Septoria linicola TaxID=215465 RepID=A0A9Q9EHR4_9PEZI|nr:putative store-operated calcium entry-associated regulatory factor [Septoria linicola]USW51240.1 Putative store-operated calcium entry-associated regulatory factor [Septoria linicola]
MRLAGLILTVLSIYTSSALGRSWSKNKDAVLLSTVKALTLRDGATTTHRRVSALPQLTCVGGNAKGLYTVDRMRCTNSGHEYDVEDIQWTCKADLPKEFKLGGTDVICEGYDSPEDPYVLKGSCAVQYRLILTKAGEERYGVPKSNWFGGSERVKPVDQGDRSESGDTIATYIFWLFFLGVLGVIIWSVWTGGGNQNGGRRRPGPRGGGGAGYGGFDDDNNDPPPPYTPRAPRPKSTRSAPTSSTSDGGNAWRPGFWSGTAAGAAGAYAANQWANRNNRTQYQQPQAGPSNWFRGGARRQQYGAPQPEPSGWFGGGGGGGSSYGAGPSSSSSSSRYESSGFGGTTRR